MRKKNRSGRGSRRRSGGDGEPDLFAKELSKVVERAFAGVVSNADADKGTFETSPLGMAVEDRINIPSVEALDTPAVGGGSQGMQQSAVGETDVLSKVWRPTEALPARMLNEFVYCRRLFYYEHVEGVFVESADTVKGAAVHARVDKGRGSLPEPKVSTQNSTEEDGETNAVEGDEIHSRSVMLGSDRLGVVAKMDLVEATLDEGGNVAAVCPVDYKVGAPPRAMGLCAGALNVGETRRGVASHSNSCEL
jgi:hypothetical protein